MGNDIERGGSDAASEGSMTTTSVTTRGMRAAVAGWLREEKATIVQATRLQSAIEAGAIAGSTYEGKRSWDSSRLEQVSRYQTMSQDAPLEPTDTEEGSCGCLVDTLERIKNNRPIRALKGASLETFSLAQMIGLGDTPQNSRWARAAVRGITDYIAEVEAAQ